jgi:hypothetical protein
MKMGSSRRLHARPVLEAASGLTEICCVGERVSNLGTRLTDPRREFELH